LKWSPGCWYGKHIFVYGEAGLKKDHPVLEFLRRDGKAARVTYFKDGMDAIAEEYPFLVTASIKANVTRRPYPSEIVPGLLYLGDWDHAADAQQLEQLNIRGILTIHNHPDNLRPGPRIKHLKIEAPDVESHDISQHFVRSFDFIEEARARKSAVLVHCGAGVSRSATLCAAYLMRKRLWTCHQAMTHVVECRSIADPNEGFVGCLHALGTALGVSAGGPAAKAGAAEAMVGEKVVVREVGDGGKKDRRREEPRHGRHDRDRERDRGRDGRREERKRGRSRSRSPERGAPECAGAGEAFLVLEVVKDGKVVSKLEIPELKPNQRCIFGRAPTCDVVLEHLSVSRQHAQLSRDDAGGLSLMDLGTSHGTNLNDVWLRPNAAKQLSAGAVIRFGASTRSYRVASISGSAKR